MKELCLSRTTLVWAVLVAATLVSWQLGHGAAFNSAKSAGAAILVVTFVKVRFVMLEFMELRDAPRWMRLICQAWLALLATVLIALLVVDRH